MKKPEDKEAKGILLEKAEEFKEKKTGAKHVLQLFIDKLNVFNYFNTSSAGIKKGELKVDTITLTNIVRKELQHELEKLPITNLALREKFKVSGVLNGQNLEHLQLNGEKEKLILQLSNLHISQEDSEKKQRVISSIHLALNIHYFFETKKTILDLIMPCILGGLYTTKSTITFFSEIGNQYNIKKDFAGKKILIKEILKDGGSREPASLENISYENVQNLYVGHKRSPKSDSLAIYDKSRQTNEYTPTEGRIIRLEVRIANEQYIDELLSIIQKNEGKEKFLFFFVKMLKNQIDFHNPKPGKRTRLNLETVHRLPRAAFWKHFLDHLAATSINVEGFEEAKEFLSQKKTLKGKKVNKNSLKIEFVKEE